MQALLASDAGCLILGYQTNKALSTVNCFLVPGSHSLWVYYYNSLTEAKQVNVWSECEHIIV